MGAERTLTVRILGDATGATRALGQIDSATETTGSKFSALVKSAAFTALGALALKFGKDSVAAFKESEDAQTRLSSAFAKSPALANANIDSLRRLNAELARKTRFDDDATASGQAVLAGFKLTGEQLSSLTPLLQDYAARTGKDLPTAATDLGKAVLGQGRALKAIGVEFHDTGSAAGNFAEVQAALSAKVGGFAEKEGKTAAGQAAILRNQFGELEEKVGSVLVPALTKLANGLLAIVDWFSRLNPGVQAAIGIGAGFAAVVVAITQAMKAWDAVWAALNLVMAANPIVLITLAIAALVAGIIIAYQHSERFRAIVQGAFGAVGDAARALAGLIEGWIIHPWEVVLGFVTRLPGRIAAAASGMWDGVKDAFRSALNWIIGKWNALHFSIHIPEQHIPGTNFSIGGGTIGFGVPTIPMLATGGTATRAGWALVGENGPELLNMPAGASVVPLSRDAGGINVVVNAPNYVGDKADLMRVVIEELRRYVGRGGDLGIA